MSPLHSRRFILTASFLPSRPSLLRAAAARRERRRFKRGRRSQRAGADPLAPRRSDLESTPFRSDWDSRPLCTQTLSTLDRPRFAPYSHAASPRAAFAAHAEATHELPLPPPARLLCALPPSNRSCDEY
eukprot:6211408-Pleurochrysis_carterae.AAC.2